MEQRGDRVELLAIEGEQLSAVTFVQDYVQLHFDGPTITAITRPAVIVGDVRFDIETPGYRDQLCDRIANRVVHAYVVPGDRLQLDFSDRSSVIISLRPEDYRAAEAAIFSDGKTEQWGTW